MNYNSKLTLACMMGAMAGAGLGLSVAEVYSSLNPLQKDESPTVLFLSSILMGIGVGALLAFFLYTCIFEGNEKEYDEIGEEAPSVYLNY